MLTSTTNFGKSIFRAIVYSYIDIPFHTERAALWAALESGRTRWLVLCGSLVGLAFTTKMLEAFIVLPAFGLVYLVCAGTPLKRRIVDAQIRHAAFPQDGGDERLRGLEGPEHLREVAGRFVRWARDTTPWMALSHGSKHGASPRRGLGVLGNQGNS